ncbi:hypothetical protein CDJ04_16110 [Salmonella enterica]|nr:hypothetical protein [Salmonella enterica]EBZ5137265.1 hypothetical protein [Salmonella enterica subsp. enterica serovar Antsalova]ECE6542961.1 hypothetical protein [Salmonella enterica subsp. enterica]EHI8597828.1 hypothetical protein [Salmonella enterica subsp. enterica serovar 51:z:1,5]HBM0095194.1 hypothetical protein [Salmonella enterica subsp. enterica serovar Blitta]
MIDITEIIKEKDNEFISLREFFTRIKLQQPKYTDVDIAKFLLWLRKEGSITFNDNNGENVFYGHYIPSLVKQDFCGFTRARSSSEDPTLTDLLENILLKGKMPTKPMVKNPMVETPMDFEDDIPF